MLLPHSVFIKFNIPASPDPAWGTFLPLLTWGLCTRTPLGSHFFLAPHWPCPPQSSLDCPSPESFSPALLCTVGDCQLLLRWGCLASSPGPSDLRALDCELSWSLSAENRALWTTAGAYPGLMTHCEWLPPHAVSAHWWQRTVWGPCRDLSACHLDICLRRREWSYAVTWESLPVWWQRGHVGSGDVSCSARSGDSCLHWGPGTEGWMLARSLGQSYGNNCCLGQNTFSDTLGVFGCRHHALKIHANLRVFFSPHLLGKLVHMSGLILGLFIFQGWRFLVHLGLLLEIEWMIFTLAPLVQKGLPRVSRSMFRQHRQTDRQTDRRPEICRLCQPGHHLTHSCFWGSKCPYTKEISYRRTFQVEDW